MQSPKRAASPLAVVLILSAVFFVLFLFVSGALFLSRSGGRGSSTGPVTGALFGGGSVGVVEVNGVILDSKKIIQRLERFEDNDEVKAVVVRLNSPGGSVGPSQEIYQAVRKLKKPVVASMGSVAASGAFYIACGAKKVFANPGTITGSIGVIMEFANLEKLYEWAKIRRFTIKTGRYKDAGAEYREMTADERALLQGMVDDVLVQFKQAVAEGRKLTNAQVTAIADGRILSGSQAKAAKLVDELGTLQDAIAEAGRLGKVKGKPNVIYPEKQKRKFVDLLLDDRQGDDSEAASGEGWLARAARALIGGGPGDSAASGLRALDEGVSGFGPGIYWLWTGAR
jgi:protease-4